MTVKMIFYINTIYIKKDILCMKIFLLIVIRNILASHQLS
jgi:hypothetical protein